MTSERLCISRRIFINSLAAAWMTLFFHPFSSKAANGQMIRKPIPATGEQIPVIGLGTYRTFQAGSDTEELNNLADVLGEFFAQGGELIDSSPMYGTSEQVIGTLLERLNHTGPLFSATKVWTNGRQSGIRQMKESLDLWGLDRFDLMQIHNLRDWEVHLETLKEWKAAGKIRYIGITTSHGRDHRELETVLAREPFDFVQLTYSISNRTVEQRLLPLAQERGIAVLANRPYQGGSLFRQVKGKTLPPWAEEFDCRSWGQFFLKFIVSHPAITCVIPATSKLHHLRDNMGAGFGRLPDERTREKMLRHFLYL